jgi:quinol monooxygenase YgiN
MQKGGLSMILEIAEYRAITGQADAFAAGIEQGLEVIRRAEGCLSAQVGRAVEDDHEFVILIRWRNLEDHLDTFRKGPLFGEYRSHITGLFVDQPRVRHFPISESY